MADSAPTIKDVEQLIHAGNMAYDAQSKRAGLKVFDGTNGVYVAAFNANGEQVRFNATQKSFLNSKLPALYPHATIAGGDVLFGREGERERLAIGMKSRLEHVRANEGKTISAIESLDTNPNRTVPTLDRLKQLTPKDHKEFPRAATWVQLKPEPPRRYIAISELSFKTGSKRIRPDEVFISYVLDQTELDQVTGPNAKKFTDLANIKAHDLRVHVADLNTELSESTALKHFEKTNKYLIETLKKLSDDWNINPQGSVKVSARDTYLQSAMARLGAARDGGKSIGATVVRWRNIFQQAAQQAGQTSVIHLAMELELKIVNGVRNWTPKVSDVTVIGNLADTALKSAVRNLANNDIVLKLAKVFR